MMNHRIVCSLFAIFLVLSCSRYPSDVEWALEQAGGNRVELEKLLAHYSQRKEDRLKLKSAYFLIANMPYHYTIHDAALDSFKTYLNGREPEGWMLPVYQRTVGPITGKKEIKRDLHHVTADFLIRNIDFSFRVWRETPWGKSVSFDDFCEEILPYRISNEPLENWKEEYHAAFRPIVDTMNNNHLPEEVCMQLLGYLKKTGWTQAYEFPVHGFGALMLLHKRFGKCKEQAEYISYILRSLGIPSGIDLIIQNRHSWNYMRNIAGEQLSFDYFYDSQLANVKKSPRKHSGKIYRKRYALQKEALPVKYRDKYAPPGLTDVLLCDVSSEYLPDTHISARMPDIFGKDDLAYLCVFNNIEWLPVAYCMPQKGKVVFLNVEQDILYQIWLMDGKRNIAASSPFILRGNEDAQFLDADMTNLQSMTLSRKYPLPTTLPGWVHGSVGGKFQGANRTDFSDSVTLHAIRKVADMSYEAVKTEHCGAFKYVRYLSANGAHNNMAEAQFYSNGEKLHGRVIGTDGAKEDFPNSTKDAVFDDDPLTFFDAQDADGAWAGLELDKAYRIDAIRYIFRNDDNNIRPGDTYELLYQSNSQWLSAGRQTADTTVLHYEKVPSHTLYWLRNHSRGREERPFTYENGNQIWW